MQSAPPDELQQTAQRRILVVDDDLNGREGLRRWLVGEGHGVETAADGWQALRRLKESRFDIAIIALDPPAMRGVGLTGWDLARIARAYHPRISIIMIGSDTGETLKAQLETLQASAFLEKPINLDRMKRLVRRIDRRRGNAEQVP